MKASELKELTVNELEQRESTLRRELWKARFDNHTNQLDDTAKIARLRRDIARVKTLLTERKRAKG
ncbi:MAG: 50S ribosomal protein L29 [Sandaracinaceae bacterium]|nr:50S ribosomal protein L29 [Sandaracinaceae bacterium]MCC6876259.1 50S ribosomal protein L29 [Sandaracinaceae bacterium]